MEKIKFIIGFGLMTCTLLLRAQSVPIPKLHWTFDQTDYNSTLADFKARDNNNDIITDDNIYGRLYNPGGSFKTDRHNANGKAFLLNNNASIVFSDSNSKFFGLSKYNADPDAFTISVWIKFTDSQKTERLIFGAKESSSDSDDIKFGISLKEKSLYLKQYFEPFGTNNIGMAWEYRLIPPAEFDAGFGWYHLTVIFAKTQKYMRILIGKPNGGAEYGPGTSTAIPGSNKVKREFDGRLIWIPGIRDKLKDFSYWFIGNTSGLIFDDLMIFDKDLTLDEVKLLYNDQKPTGFIAKTRSKKSAKNEVLADDEVEFGNEITQSLKLFPNPSRNLTTISFKTVSSGIASVIISDILGGIIYSERFKVFEGYNERILDVKSLGLPSGLYFVNLETPNGIMNKKLIVK